MTNQPTTQTTLVTRPNGVRLVAIPLPHVASATHETRQAMADLAVENLALHFAGKPVKTLVPELAGKVSP